MATTATYTIRKPYHLGKKMIIDEFDQDGEVMITFFPKKEELYIESDKYLNDPTVFVAHNREESKAFLDSLKSS